MPLTDEYAHFLQELNSLQIPPIQDVEPVAARQMFKASIAGQPEIEVGNVTDVDLTVAGGSIALRIYQPNGDGPFPLILMFHGGGWVLGDLDTADFQSRMVCRGTDSVVVSVDYRLAPEHQFPTAVNDCYAALEYIRANAPTLGGDSKRIAVAGDSAGGNLAAAVAIKNRDEGGPALRHQLLVYPVTDGTNFDTASYVDNAEGYLLTKAAMQWFWDCYTKPDDRLHPLASPLQSSDLTGLPPATVLTAEFDPLRDEGEAYGERLKESGVPCEIIRYDGFIHGFFGHGASLPSTKKAMDDSCEILRRALAV